MAFVETGIESLSSGIAFQPETATYDDDYSNAFGAPITALASGSGRLNLERDMHPAHTTGNGNGCPSCPSSPSLLGNQNLVIWLVIGLAIAYLVRR